MIMYSVSSIQQRKTEKNKLSKQSLWPENQSRRTAYMLCQWTLSK